MCDCDGECFWFCLIVILVEELMLCGVIVLCIDLIEDCEEEEVLRFYEFVLEKVLGFVFWFEFDGGFYFVNDCFCWVFGYM